MKRFLDPYYSFNTVMTLAFGLLLWHFMSNTPVGTKYGRLHNNEELLQWGRQSMATLLAIVTWKGFRCRSWDDFAQQAFFYGKVVTALTAIMVDVRLFVWYALAAWGCYAALPQPMQVISNGQDGDKVMILTPQSMKEQVLKGEGNWLVYLYTAQHDPSIAMAPAFSELAEKYASEELKFGCIDICLWPGFARELRLNTNKWSNQLPAVIMYSNGKEQGRIPTQSAVDELGLKKNYYTKVIQRLTQQRLAPPQCAK
eukprot:GHRR01032333.1.p1 GENE.GHRR01032333.1~~GHRR01032333.1.p1  ORF type:complete len:256 (+),score=47.88 GHRR01032333.1:157-924(+)